MGVGYLSVNGSESEDGSSLLVDESAESGLSLNEHERDLLSPAELGQPHNDLDGVDVVGDDHKLGLAFLDESCNVVESVLDNGTLFLFDGLLPGGLLSSGLS